MAAAELLSRVAAELALFAGAGFLLFAINDLLVDVIYFARLAWREVTVYTRYPRAFADGLGNAKTLSEAVAPAHKAGFIAILVPAWDEAAVIAAMLRATLSRLDYPAYTIFVGYYRNDPATLAAIASIKDARIEAVEVDADGPTTKADCLNHLYDALIDYEIATDSAAKAIVLHDAEDVVHPLELRLFDRLIDRAAVIQLPVVPLPDPNSRWISGHYCDEFAEAHIKELVVREAVGAAIPLAGVGCAIARKPLAQLAAMHEGKPFAGNSMTEDYEVGLRLGALGLKTIFVRIPARHGQRGVVASRGHFPATLGNAVRQKARWLGGIALAGWDRLGWSGGLGERWMRMRDRRGPLAAVLLLAAYSAALLWSQVWLAEWLGAPIAVRIDPVLVTLLIINGWLLAWRILMRACFTASGYGFTEGLLSIPRLVIGNIIAMLAAGRAVSLHVGGGQALGKDAPHLSRRAAAMRPSLRFLALAVAGWAGVRAATLGPLPGVSFFAVPPSPTTQPAPVAQTQFPPIEPLQPAIQEPQMQPGMIPAGWPAMYGQPLTIPVYYSYPAAPPRPAPLTPIAPEPRPAFFPPVPQLDEWPLSRMASNAIPARSSVVTPMQTTSPAIVQARLDRIQLVMWAMLRGQQGQILGPTSLASGGQLGGSQAGGRLFYNFTPDIAAVLRSSSDVGRRGGEVAAGIRVRPIRSIPVWFTAERRQRLLKFGGGRNAFAFFAEGGVYDRPMPWGFTLDGYAQGGIVGLKSRDLFADGGVTFTRPVYRQFSAGLGVWGGIQPGLYRVDVGPRVTMKVRKNVRVHLDWRQRVAGNAEPGSGPAVTLSGNF